MYVCTISKLSLALTCTCSFIQCICTCMYTVGLSMFSTEGPGQFCDVQYVHVYAVRLRLPKVPTTVDIVWQASICDNHIIKLLI